MQNIDSKITALSVSIGAKLLKLHQTIAVAESLTAGLLCSSIASISGASKYLKGGVCSYTDEVKRKVLGVDAGLLLTNTAVDKDVAYLMARGVRDLFGSSIAISTTGYAGSLTLGDIATDDAKNSQNIETPETATTSQTSRTPETLKSHELLQKNPAKPADEPVGLVYIGIISPKQNIVQRFDFAADPTLAPLTREYVQKLTVLNALTMLDRII